MCPSYVLPSISWTSSTPLASVDATSSNALGRRGSNAIRVLDPRVLDRRKRELMSTPLDDTEASTSTSSAHRGCDLVHVLGRLGHDGIDTNGHGAARTSGR